MRPEADMKRLRYLLATTFLGRMCISGDVEKLQKWQWEMIGDAINLYKECTHIIANAKIFRKGTKILSYAKPQGYQVVGLMSENGILLVLHTFEHEGSIEERINELRGYQIAKRFGDENVEVEVSDEGNLAVLKMQPFDGLVIRFEKR